MRNGPNMPRRRHRQQEQRTPAARRELRRGPTAEPKRQGAPWSTRTRFSSRNAARPDGRAETPGRAMVHAHPLLVETCGEARRPSRNARARHGPRARAPRRGQPLCGFHASAFRASDRVSVGVSSDSRPKRDVNVDTPKAGKHGEGDVGFQRIAAREAPAETRRAQRGKISAAALRSTGCAAGGWPSLHWP